MITAPTQLTVNTSSASAARTAPPMRNRSRCRQTQATVVPMLAWPVSAELAGSRNAAGTRGRNDPGRGSGRSGQPSFTAVPDALTISMLLPTVS